jgi:succinate-semialdehyde dehydrogenase/glutarate-semialdehyde dehydrogenase
MLGDRLASLFIGGRWQRTQGGELEVRNPASGQALARIGYGDAADAARAAAAAADAFPSWSRLPARERAERLIACATLLVQRQEEIGRLLSQETGKRLPEAVAEVRFASEYFRWFAEEARRPIGHLIPNEDPGRRHLTLARAAGVAICLTPWNFPVSIPARKLAAALAAGCTVVARPSQKAPLAAIELFHCLEEAGFPPGVANLVHGPAEKLTPVLLDHPATRVVSFTGSTEVGRTVMAQASHRVVRPLLELGGDAPFIVCADADLERAVEGAMLAKFRNNGQSCIAANRFLVEEDVYDEFVGQLVAKVDAMAVGDPLAEPCPDLGPVIDDGRRLELERLVEEAIAAGARVLTRERALPARGSYVAPQLLADVPGGVGLGCQEVFGPIAGIFRFRGDAEALELANRTELGLAAYVYTRDLRRAWTLAEGLEVGIVGVDHALPSAAFAPMGGVKLSGLGREGARAGLEEFLQVSYLSLGL